MGETDLPLFRAWPGLRERLPRCPLGSWPTPVQHLSRYGAAVRAPNLWIKREDLSRAPSGGNKVRGLEFLIGRAKSLGADEIFTFGAAGSFHVRSTAQCARSAGLRTTAFVIHQPNSAYVVRNLTAAFEAGAQLVPVHLPMLPIVFSVRWLTALARGNRIIVIPPGGTSPLACIGHVNAALELKAQIDRGELPCPDFLFVPMGSLGTAAGLAAGLSLAGLKTRIVGVVVFSRWYCTAGRWSRLANRTLRLLHACDSSIPRLNISPSTLYAECGGLGRGYAHFTEDGVAAARLLHETEGLELDGSYTAKMYAGAMQFLHREDMSDSNVLIWHTYSRGDEPSRIPPLPRGLRRYVDRPRQPLDALLPRSS